MTPKDVALQTIEAGYKVVPFKPTKKPAFLGRRKDDKGRRTVPPDGPFDWRRGWNRDALETAEQVERFWADYPDSLAGSLFPKAGDRTLLDVEGPGHDVSGLPVLAEIEQRVDLSAFPRIITPSGGVHIYGRQPDVLNGGKLYVGAGIEVFGAGGGPKCVVMPPATVTGQSYGTGVYRLGDGTDISDLFDPKELPPEIFSAKPARTATRGINGQPITSRDAATARHDRMLYLALDLAQIRKTDDEILEALKAWRDEEGWDDKNDDELERIAQWAGATVEDAPEIEEVPLECLEDTTQAAPEIAAAWTAEERLEMLAKSHVAAGWVKPQGDEGPPRDEVTFYSVDDLASLGDEEVPWILPDFLAPGEVTGLVGREKAGKTTMVYAMIAKIERGEHFLGRATVKSNAVILSEEPGSIVLEKCRRFNIHEARILPRHGIHGLRNWADRIRAGVEECVRAEAGILLLDSFAKIAGLAESQENDAGAVQAAFDALHAATNDEIAVAIIHHGAKGEKHGTDLARGSTAFVAALDTFIAFRKPQKSSSERVLEFTGRHADYPDPTKVDLRRNEYYLTHDTFEGSEAELWEKVRRALAAAPDPLTRSGVAKAVGGRETTVRDSLDRFVNKNLVAREGAGKRGNPYTFTLTKKGAERCE